MNSRNISQPRWKIELGAATDKAVKQTADQDNRKIWITGHRNPDTDSIASAFAYAELKKIMGSENVFAAAPGLASAKTEFLFKKFATTLPPVINDVSPKLKDIMNPTPPVAKLENSLLEVMDMLQESRQYRIPVVGKEGEFSGMISLFDMADRLFQKPGAQGVGGGGRSLIGREIMASLNLAATTLNADILCGENLDEIETFDIYVGAMSTERLKSLLSRKRRRNKLGLIVGDRYDVHKLAVDMKIPLMIITGHSETFSELINQAKKNGTAILRTPFDSATTVRRLKFSSPASLMLNKEVQKYSPEDKIKDVISSVMKSLDDVFPVVSQDMKLAGVITKYDFEKEAPVSLILVDHNELDQSIQGANSVPVVEIVDHHRIGISPTDVPIKITSDIVGSTCTMITEKFRQNGFRPKRGTAGILMGGIVSDTLCLRSPTTTERDRQALKWLEKIAGCESEELYKELMGAGSIVATKQPLEVLSADRKDYSAGKYKIAVAQVEESGFENFSTRKAELLEALKELVSEDGLDFFGLLVTNVIRETSVMLAAGRHNIMENLPWPALEPNLYELEGVMSRKKQLLPKLLKVMEDTV